MHLRKTVGQAKMQLQYILSAAIVMYLAGSIYFLYIYNYHVPPVTDTVVAISNLVIAYAIIRHRLMDVSIIIKRTIVYSVVITSITTLYFLLIYALKAFYSQFVGINSPL